MAGFKDIIGHTQIIEHFQNAIKLDKISHAYILNGPDLSGKKERKDVWNAIPVNRRLAIISRISDM